MGKHKHDEVEEVVEPTQPLLVPGIDCDLEVVFKLTPTQVAKLGKRWGAGDPPSVEGMLRSWVTSELALAESAQRKELQVVSVDKLKGLDSETLSKLADLIN